jgi:hypothetical protein
MGESGAASVADATALFWNPASLLRAPRTSVVVGRVPYLDGAAKDHLAVSRAIGQGVLAVGLGSFSHGTFTGTDVEGYPADTLEPKDSQMVLGYARQFSAFPWLAGYGGGASVKQVSSQLSNTAKTYCWDVGLLSKGYRDGRLRWGFSSLNNGGKLQYNQESEPLSRTLRAGTVWAPAAPWTVSADIVKRTGQPLALAGGAEYSKILGNTVRVFSRGGYTTEQESLNGLRLGLGFEFKSFQMNYAYRFTEDESASHGIELTFQWDERGKGLPPALQSLIDRGNSYVESGRYPEAVVVFYDALKMEPACRPARDGLERAYRLMQGR